ncbi:MAG: hypothetical protein ACREMV_04915 [Gemmatimonadales bacterium]
MRARWDLLALGTAATLACGESAGPGPDPRRLPVIDSIRLFRCDEDYPTQIACGLLMQNDSGFWVRSPGAREYGPMDPADVVLNQRYTAWAYYRDTRLVRADLCWLPSFGRFCSTTQTWALADTGAARLGHWAAIFVLFRPGEWRVIFRGESSLGTTTDSIMMHVDSITTPPPPPLREGSGTRPAGGVPATLSGPAPRRAATP